MVQNRGTAELKPLWDKDWRGVKNSKKIEKGGKMKNLILWSAF